MIFNCGLEKKNEEINTIIAETTREVAIAQENSCEALISKQRHNYQNLCAAYKFAYLPLQVHLFKAVEFCLQNILQIIGTVLRKRLINRKWDGKITIVFAMLMSYL